MDLEKEIKEKLMRLQDVNKQLAELSKKIGALQEEGRAIHQGGLELKGALDMLVGLKAKEEEALAKSKTAGLILPEGVKPVVEETVGSPLGRVPNDAQGTAEIPANPALEPAIQAEIVDTGIPGPEAAPTVLLGETTVEAK